MPRANINNTVNSVGGGSGREVCHGRRGVEYVVHARGENEMSRFCETGGQRGGFGCGGKFNNRS